MNTVAATMQNPEKDMAIIAGQATINIGTIGHVAHGKSTLTEALSGIKPVKFKEEKERNITIHLGYANAKIYKCDTCPRPDCYIATGSGEKKTTFPCRNLNCNGKMTLIRHISLVDTPGHDSLMATMINGASVMDAAILLIGANQKCPQPQTLEHLAAAEIMQLKPIIIAQNKADLMTPSSLREHKQQINEFVQGTVAEDSPIIPIAAIQGWNLNVLCEYLDTKITHPLRDLNSPVRMVLVRSFDVNKPGDLEKILNLKGGVLGGTILSGVLRIGDEIEIKPGIEKEDPDTGEVKWYSLRTRVISLYAEGNSLQSAVPGGLIGVGSKLDPSLTKGDNMKGQVLGHVGTLPDNLIGMEISYFLMKRLVGGEDGKNLKVKRLEKSEILQINIGSVTTKGYVQAVVKDLAKLKLQRPVCSSEGERIAISRRIGGKWRLIGWGRIEKGISTPSYTL